MINIVKNIESFISKFNDSFSEKVNTEIRDWDEIKDIISFFITNDKGTPILDFIDMSNWDRIENFSFDDGNREAVLTWHEFESPKNDFEIEFFGTNIWKCEIHIDSIVITVNKGIPVLLIKSYYKDKKAINRNYNKGCSDFYLDSFHPFCSEVRRIVKRKIETITIPNINCFTASIVPNCARFLKPNDSKEILYSYNLKVVSDRLIRLISEIERLDESEQEELQNKGNIARRNFENALKILNLRAGEDFEDDYQKLMLGSLVGVLRNFKLPGNTDIKLKDVQETLNKCSHDAGVHISKDDLLKSILFIIAAINIQNS